MSSSPPPPSPPSSPLSIFPYLKTLAVFRHDVLQGKIRSVHVYEFDGGMVEIVEREFKFYEVGAYEEVNSPDKLFTLVQDFDVSRYRGGVTYGNWICLLGFNKNRISRFNLESIPDILSLLKNPKLAYIPTLARDLEVIYQLKLSSPDDAEPSGSEESFEDGESSEYEEQEESFEDGESSDYEEQEESFEDGESSEYEEQEESSENRESSENGGSSKMEEGPSEIPCSPPPFEPSLNIGSPDTVEGTSGIPQSLPLSESSEKAAGISERSQSLPHFESSERKGSSETVEGPSGKPKTPLPFDLNLVPQSEGLFDLNLKPPSDTDD